MSRYGKMFLLDNGTVTIRNDAGEKIFFPSIADFEKHYEGLDLTGKTYIDYEPGRKMHIDDDGSGQAGKQGFKQQSQYEAVFSQFETLKALKSDPYYKATLADAQAIKRSEILKATEALSRKILPVWKFGLILFNEMPTEEVDFIKARYVGVLNAAKLALSQLERTATVDEVKAVNPVWPVSEQVLCDEKPL